MTGVQARLWFRLILFTVCLIAAAPSSAQPRVRLFTFSRDSLAGFKDPHLELFRRDLGKSVEAFMELAYTQREAKVSVQYLGAGELDAQLSPTGETTGYLWRSDEESDRIWAVLRVGDFSREFTVQGGGGRSVGRLAKNIADWIEANRTVLREKSLVPDPAP